MSQAVQDSQLNYVDLILRTYPGESVLNMPHSNEEYALDTNPFFYITNPHVLRRLAIEPSFDIHHVSLYGETVLSAILELQERTPNPVFEEFIITTAELGFNFNMMVKDSNHPKGEQVRYLDTVIYERHPKSYQVVKSVLGALQERQEISETLSEQTAENPVRVKRVQKASPKI